MTWIITEMFFLMSLIVLPVTLYKSNRPIMTKFYLRMASDKNARKLYVRCFLIFLLLYHYVYAGGHPGEWGILPSTILCAVMFSFKRAEKLMRMLYSDRRIIIVTAVLTLAICAVPHLHTTSVTLGYLLLARLFYPSFSFIALWEEDEESRLFWTRHPEVLPEHYFH